MFFLGDFYLFRLDRDISNFTENNGGGLITYVNKSWCPNKPKLLSQLSEPDIELLSILCRPRFLNNNYHCVIIFNIYLRPQSNKSVSQKLLRNLLINSYKKYPKAFILICGDANSSTIQPAEEFSLINILQCPTYYPNESQLDVCYVPNIDIYYYSSSPPIGGANINYHLSFFIIPKRTCKNKYKKPKKSIEYDKDTIINTLSETDWSIFEEDDINSHVDVIDSYIEFVLHSYTRYINKDNITIMNRIRNNNHLKLLVNMKKKAIKSGCNRERNIIQKQITSTVKAIRKQYISSLSCKEIYELVRYHYKSETNSKLITVDDAEKLNTFFTRFNSDIVKDNIQYHDTSESYHYEHEISEFNVSTLFRHLKSNSSSGPSKLPVWLFKEGYKELSSVYCKLYNRSLKEKTYPNTWKKAAVTACPKTKEASIKNPKSFRPIAVTPIQARCLDKIVLQEVQKSMKDSEDVYQFAYKENLSTTDALLVTNYILLKFLDENCGSMVKILFLDYSSAFNTVLQNQLLNKIQDKNPHLAQWIYSYMTGWCQYVKATNNSFSSVKNLVVGIPQGGPLSAKLFTYITDDINNNTLQIQNSEGNLAKYSDDTRIIKFFTKLNGKNQQKLYQNIVNNISSISDFKNLKLNELKSEEIVIYNKNSKNEEISAVKLIPIYINNKSCPRSTNVKYLGLTYSDNLEWSKHITNICVKVNFMIKCLSKIIFYMSETQKVTIYKTLIIPNILYAAEAWGTASLNKDRKRIKKTVKYFSKISLINFNQLVNILNSSFHNKIIYCIDKILHNTTHPLHIEMHAFKNTSSTRNAWNVRHCRTDKFNKSFFPQALLYLNNPSKKFSLI